MTITVNLSVDLYEQIAEEAKRSGHSVDYVLNARLRIAYRMQSKARFTVEPFKTDGFAPGVKENTLNALFDTLEIDEREG